MGCYSLEEIEKSIAYYKLMLEICIQEYTGSITSLLFLFVNLGQYIMHKYYKKDGMDCYTGALNLKDNDMLYNIARLRNNIIHRNNVKDTIQYLKDICSDKEVFKIDDALISEALNIINEDTVERVIRFYISKINNNSASSKFQQLRERLNQ